MFQNDLECMANNKPYYRFLQRYILAKILVTFNRVTCLSLEAKVQETYPLCACAAVFFFFFFNC